MRAIKKRTKVLIIAASAIGIVIAGVVPFGLLAVPNPPGYRRVADMTERGAYLQTANGLLHLYPYPKPLQSPPATLAETDANPRLMIKARQYFGEEGYRLEPFPDGAPVGLTLSRDDQGVMNLVPSDPLPDGPYLLTAEQDSVYGGEDYYYFAVRAGPTQAGRSEGTPKGGHGGPS